MHMKTINMGSSPYLRAEKVLWTLHTITCLQKYVQKHTYKAINVPEVLDSISFLSRMLQYTKRS